MSLEKIRHDLTARLQEVNQEPPASCAGCRNLDPFTVGTGRVVLSCLLERAAVQMTGPRDELAKNGATAEWVARALTTDILDPTAGKDRGAIDFSNRAAVANEDCPIVDKVLDQLPDANARDLIDLKPPEPLLEYRNFRIAIGLDEPRS